MSADEGPLRLNDALRVTSVGLRARPLRAALSALGIAIGTAAIVAVLGLSSSSQAGLLAEIDRLGTNMLTLEAGQSLTGLQAQLPREAPERITRLDHVEQVAHTALIKSKNVYRSRHPRRARRRRRNGHLRQLEALAHRDPRRSMDGRHRLGHPDRRVRRPDAGHPSLPDAAHRGIADGMNGMDLRQTRRGRAMPRASPGQLRVLTQCACVAPAIGRTRPRPG